MKIAERQILYSSIPFVSALLSQVDYQCSHFVNSPLGLVVSFKLEFSVNWMQFCLPRFFHNEDSVLNNLFSSLLEFSKKCKILSFEFFNEKKKSGFYS